MINREVIKNNLEVLGFSYQIEKNVMNENAVDTYFIKSPLKKGNLIGAITDSRTTEDRDISIFLVLNNKKNEDSVYLLNKVNEFNLNCKCGKFYMDDVMDITYSVSIPVINEWGISEAEFKFYLSNALTIVLGVMEKLDDE